jgi:glycosyltransferase involved in cell wall biosynthesis
MKIIFCVSSVSLFNSGGMNRVIADTLPILRSRGIPYLLICPRSLLTLCKGLTHLIINNPFSYDFIVFNSLAAVRRKNKYWKVLFYLSKAFSWKKIIYWHEMPSYFEKYKNLNAFEAGQILRLFNRKRILHLTVSESNSKLVDEFFYNATKRLVYNTIDAKRLTGWNRFHYPSIVTIGSVQEIKGTDIWTKVAVEVCKKNSQAHFLWCGSVFDNELYQKCLKEISANNLEDRVQFIGYVSNPVILIQYSYLFFLPSRSDSMPLVVLEAMACGKNVIYYDSGGAREALGDFGILIDDFDINKTITKILEYLDNFDEGRDMVNENLMHRFQQNFTPEIFTERFLNSI